MKVLSKLKRPKATRIIGGALGLLLALSLVLVPATPALALPPPGHYFGGNVTSQGVPVAPGTEITAKVAGLEYTTRVDAEGKYGWTPNEFSIPGDDPDTPEIIEGASAGDSIEFYIGDIKLHLYDVEAGTWLESYPFESGGTTELNLETTRDTTPPTVLSTIPEADAAATIDVVVSATFDEVIDETTLDFTLDSVAGTVSYVGATKTASFTPDANLDYDITYTASVEASDLAGNAMPAAHTWSFTTVVNNPPTASEPLPADQAINVSTSPQLSVLTSDLDEDLMVITFYDASDNSPLGTVGEATSDTRPSVTWAGLDYEVQYGWYVKISDGINPEVTSDTWSFTTRAEGPVSFDTTLLEGWNLLSTPILLDADSTTLGLIFGTDVENIVISYSWDAQNEDWDQLTNDYELLPLYGIYVKISSGASATAEFVPYQDYSEPPSRELQPGLNLIGPAPVLDDSPDMPLDEALASIAEAADDLRGYTMVISPAYNQPPWTYGLGGDIEDLMPFQGYWVVMENADTLFGFSYTPISP